ncbi:hypothetical protein Tco_0004757 [Tanacetum coccineum]
MERQDQSLVEETRLMEHDMVAEEWVHHRIMVVELMSRTVEQLVRAVVENVMDCFEVDGCCSMKACGDNYQSRQEDLEIFHGSNELH